VGGGGVPSGACSAVVPSGASGLVGSVSGTGSPVSAGP
jgi:hypothetical protein